ncbi:MAG: protease modulator HflC [Bacteroidia bacterium]
MNTKKIIFGAVIALVIFILAMQTFYVVNEEEQAVITQFGRPVGEAITSPGVQVKIPFIQKVNYFDKRFLEWDGDPNQVPTKDKKFIFVDSYARWQIVDPLQFFKRLTNERGAQSRLDDILDGETRDFIANHYLEEAVRSSNREPLEAGAISEIIEDSLPDISVGRQKIQNMIQEAANAEAADLGIRILDFHFKRMNYVEEVQMQVYERMKSERYRIAEKFRSEGQGEASRINGEKERELKTIQSEAFKEAQTIMGQADAKAANIYASAYNQSASARELYSFLKSMETFNTTFDKETNLIISTDSELFKYLKQMQ